MTDENDDATPTTEDDEITLTAAYHKRTAWVRRLGERRAVHILLAAYFPEIPQGDRDRMYRLSRFAPPLEAPGRQPLAEIDRKRILTGVAGPRGKAA